MNVMLCMFAKSLDLFLKYATWNLSISLMNCVNRKIFLSYFYRVYKVKTHRDVDLKKNLISHNMLIAQLQ